MTAHENLNLTDTSVLAGGRCCGHSPSDEELSASPATEMAACPVMAGTPVVKAQAEAAGYFCDHNGQRYWFCCAACGPLFDADPDRYANTA
ncbi:YHS domain-containing protein [Tomitella gaofuii]|uniref:YHS domain-containing protein n=1 Tax=Tomitella gaofuii TaxID=2760083 RepID=UPI0015F85832|nr:YHS domain-containing protein [Tomitella gaofuii]